MAKQREKQYRLMVNEIVLGYYNTGSYPLRLARHKQADGATVRIEFRTNMAARAHKREWCTVWPSQRNPKE